MCFSLAHYEVTVFLLTLSLLGSLTTYYSDISLLIPSVIVLHLAEAYMAFLFPIKLLFEQRVPQHGHRFLNFVFRAFL